jgi:NAD(P)-dependent dehydrogenase (short-subunit alcohol dehydrogenase family)
MPSLVVIGGTSGIGREVAKHHADQGSEVVISGRDLGRATEAAGEIGGKTRAIALDLARPEEISAALADIEHVDQLVIAAIDRDQNTIASFDVVTANRLVTLKLVGYAEVVHALLARMAGDASIVMFGGRAKDRPYPGSITVSTVNGGISGLVRALAVEIAPIRVNAIHPGIVGDSPAWSSRPEEVLEGIKSRTPTGRLVRMADVVDAVAFLLSNKSVNGVDLDVDGGWLLL